MMTRIAISLLAGLLGASGAILAADRTDLAALERDRAVYQERRIQLANEPIPLLLLEPCINGQVSATGLYPTQAEEDAALAGAIRRAAGGNEWTAASGR